MGTTRVRSWLFRGVVAGAIAALSGGAWLGWTDRCGAWGGPPRRLAEVEAQGRLLAGAARARIEVGPPVARAGYGPMEPSADRVAAPLHARALVLEAGGVRLGLLTLDLLLLPESLAAEVRAAAAPLGLRDLLVAATHPHSSVGGYDDRHAFALAGLGWPDDRARAAVLAAAREALAGAAGALAEAALEVGGGDAPDLVLSRAEGAAPDARLTRALLRGPGGPIAQLAIFTAHPTLQPRGDRALSPDYPGLLAGHLEAGGGVALVLIGSGGNVLAALPGEAPPPDRRPEVYAGALAGRVAGVPLARVEGPVVLASRSAAVPLPRPDASRLVSPALRSPLENVLCAEAAREAVVTRWQLGPLSLLAVPAELTEVAGARLERAAGADRAIGLANGYLGYVDAEDRVRAGAGESRRQYFPPELLGALERGAALTASR